MDEENRIIAEQNIRKHFSDILEEKNITLYIFHANFVNIKERLIEKNIDFITAICYDLGVSSAHYDDITR